MKPTYGILTMCLALCLAVVGCSKSVPSVDAGLDAKVDIVVKTDAGVSEASVKEAGAKDAGMDVKAKDQSVVQ